MPPVTKSTTKKPASVMRDLATSSASRPSARPEPSKQKQGSQPTLWIMEDQLSDRLDILRRYPEAPVLMIESRTHFREWPFHKRRLGFLVAAMRHFAGRLRRSGRDVHRYGLDAEPYLDSKSALRQHIRSTGSRQFILAEPADHHTRVWIESLATELGIQIEFCPNNLFLTDRAEFAEWARGLKSPIMETFYRRMRQKLNVLMEGDEPVGGSWNLDQENRKPAPKGLVVPRPVEFRPDDITRGALADVDRHFASHPGSTDGFDLPVTHADALRAFDDFLEHRLPLFGDYEDAMLTGEPLLYHSHLSMLINAGLLDPLMLVRRVEERYRAGQVPLNSAEGFIRQIIGWREYVYGIYHAFMPEYRSRNTRGDALPLPDFFWTGKTGMNCLHQVISQVVDRAYSHHIQRLMILCNFATLVGLNPQAVNDWFLSMYVDSHDWVVTPNVIGMGMNADAPEGSPRGTMATKPYVSSAAYINRMSDYCRNCSYDQTARTGEDACPFNYLFWTFLDRHREVFSRNPRMTMMLKNASRIDASEMSSMHNARRTFVEQFVPLSMKSKVKG
jgi:deoxyribodipyrimidine photolyase-related protein